MLNKSFVLFILILALIYGAVVLFKIPPYKLISYSKNTLENTLVQDTPNGIQQNVENEVKIISTLNDLPSKDLNNRGYSFYVAGHTYGTPGVGSDGLYAPFTEKFHIINQYKPIKFGFLLGDIVKEASNEAWRLVKKI